MPRKPKLPKSEAPLAPVPSEILDQFVGQGPLTPEELEAAVRRFKKAIIERALGGELTHHLGYPPGGAKPDDTTNHRNGTSGKTVLTDDGTLSIEVPRDREGSFEPRLIGKHERRFTGFDDKIIALYARGMTVREIQAFLAEMYAVEVSPDLISTVTDAIVTEVTTWQSRPSCSSMRCASKSATKPPCAARPYISRWPYSRMGPATFSESGLSKQKAQNSG
jgi:transposase-like protein